MGVLHEGIDTGPADEVPDQEILELEERGRFKGQPVIIDKGMHLFQEDAFAVFLDLIGGEDQHIPQVLVQPFQQFIFKIRERGFKEEVFFLVCPFVMGDDDERAALFDPVLVNQFIILGDPGIDKSAVPFKIIFIDR